MSCTRTNTPHELSCLQEGITDITYERDGYIYFIENTISERSSTTSGYFWSLGDAVDAIHSCCDWWASNGTGRIYRTEPGLHKCRTLVWKNH